MTKTIQKCSKCGSTMCVESKLSDCVTQGLCAQCGNTTLIYQRLGETLIVKERIKNATGGYVLVMNDGSIKYDLYSV